MHFAGEGNRLANVCRTRWHNVDVCADVAVLLTISVTRQVALSLIEIAARASTHKLTRGATGAIASQATAEIALAMARPFAKVRVVQSIAHARNPTSTTLARPHIHLVAPARVCLELKVNRDPWLEDSLRGRCDGVTLRDEI